MLVRVTTATLLAAALAIVACVACADRDEPAPAPGTVTTIADPADAIGEPLMLALSQAKNFHRKAKVYIADGNLAEATAAVRQILAIEFPAGAPEGEDVRLDAHALLAKLHLAQGDVEGAMKVVEQGLAGASRESFFLANLHTVRGEVLEAIAAGLDADGKAEEAKARRREAIAAYDTSIAINERLQQALVERMRGGAR